jgi:hypothetical protein
MGLCDEIAVKCDKTVRDLQNLTKKTGTFFTCTEAAFSDGK